MLTPAPSHFEVTSTVEPPVNRVLVVGVLDMATVPRFSEELRAVEREPGRIELDLGGLAFVDASGLHAILAAARRARRQSRRFTVARPSPQILRLFELTAIDRSLALIDLPDRLPRTSRGRRPA